MRRFARVLQAVLVAASCLSGAAAARADTWRGTAPICRGKCLPGETQIGISDDGDGGHCFSGHKVLCSNHAPTCRSTMTKASCVGVVMICENGSQLAPSNVFQACSTYACGACFFSGSGETVHTASLPGQGSVRAEKIANDTCKTGFVWREGVKDDHVCVTPQTRDQAAADNAQAASRKLPNESNCKQGFVWRVIVPSDLVCVTVETRAATAADTAAALSRIVGR